MYECDICGNTISETIVLQNFSVDVCNRCQYGKVNPVPDAATLLSLYNSPEYYATHTYEDINTLSEGQLVEISEKTGIFHLKYIKKLIPLGASILEIGCGNGLGLQYLSKAGYRVSGIELSATAASFAKEKLHLEVFNTTLEELNSTNQYDLIMLNHVLEHFTNVTSAVKKIKTLLKPNGFVYIRVPNHDSYDRKKMGLQWPAYLPFHISYFSKASLLQLFNQAGYTNMHTFEYVSDAFLKNYPVTVRKIASRLIRLTGLIGKFNGRTITLTAQNHA